MVERFALPDISKLIDSLHKLTDAITGGEPQGILPAPVSKKRKRKARPNKARARRAAAALQLDIVPRLPEIEPPSIAADQTSQQPATGQLKSSSKPTGRAAAHCLIPTPTLTGGEPQAVFLPAPVSKERSGEPQAVLPAPVSKKRKRTAGRNKARVRRAAAHSLDPQIEADNLPPVPVSPLRLIPFVFEEMFDSWNALSSARRTELMAMGAFNEERLQFCRCLWVVFQADHGVQVTLAKDLRTPHGHAYLHDGILPTTLSCEVKVVDSQPSLDTDYHFLQSAVMEQDQTLNPLMHRIHHHVLKRIHSSGAGDKHRQRYFVDLGVTSGHCFSKKREEGSGVARPAFLKETRDNPFATSIFEGLSRAIQEHCPYIWAGQDPFRQTEFAQIIGKGNRIEAIRLAMTRIDPDDAESTKASLCAVHEDRKNDRALSEVVVFSKVFWDHNRQGAGWRLSVICYTRQSIASFLERHLTTFGPSVKHVVSYVNSLEPWRRDLKLVIPTVTQGESGYGGSNFRHMSFECHMDPAAYLSPAIYFTLVMVFRFKLDYVEVVSVLRAWAGMPQTPFFFVHAVAHLLGRKELPTRGRLIGRHILKEMCRLRSRDKDDGKKIPGLRFPIYSKPVIPNDEQWGAVVDEMTFHCLTALKQADRPSCKTDRTKLYKSIYSHLNPCIENCGRLSINHLLGLTSMLGVTPLWMVHEYHQAHESPGVKALVDEHGLPSGSQAATAFLESLASSLKLGQFQADMRQGENVVCKCKRETFPKRTKFSDLYIPNTCLFGYDGGKSIIYPETSNRKSFEMEGPLLQRWPIDGGWLTTKELVKAMGDELESLQTFSIPKRMGYYGGVKCQHEAGAYLLLAGASRWCT